jgi:hypothetical protein
VADWLADDRTDGLRACPLLVAGLADRGRGRWPMASGGVGERIWRAALTTSCATDGLRPRALSSGSWSTRLRAASRRCTARPSSGGTESVTWSVPSSISHARKHVLADRRCSPAALAEDRPCSAAVLADRRCSPQGEVQLGAASLGMGR